MMNLWNIIDGSKTYIIAALAVIVIYSHVMGYITSDQMNSLLGLLGAGGAASLRHGMQKAEDASVKASDKAEVAVAAAVTAVTNAETAVEVAAVK